MENTGSDKNQNRGYKRKRRKTFLQNAKSYGKKGRYGHGTEIDSDTYQYFVRILESYKDGFSSDEDKSMFADNVFKQIENHEIENSSNQVGCRVIEMLLPFASNEYLDKYMEAFFKDLRPLCLNKFASHILQTLLEVACERSCVKSYDDKYAEKSKAYVLKISKFLLNNLEDFVWDTYGNHIIRTVFTSLAGLSSEAKNRSKIKTQDVKLETEIDDDYLEIIQDYAERLVVWPQFKDFPYSESTSGLLQVLLKALKKVDQKRFKKYVKKLLSESFTRSSDGSNAGSDGKPLLDVFISKPALMLLETTIELEPTKLYEKIYNSCFSNNLTYLATYNAISVQKILKHCQDSKLFETMFDVLMESFDELMSTNTTTILTIAETCKRLSTKQGLFSENIMKYFKCYEEEEKQNSIVMCLCRFTKYDELSKCTSENLQNCKLNLHGTLLVQHLLEFKKPIKIVQSILNIEKTDLKNLFSHSMGCHIADSYTQSAYVGEKSRERLIKKLKGHYQELASSKYGSRSFDCIWNAASLTFKTEIMNELSYRPASWSHSQFGIIVANKINLQLYMSNREEWKNFINKKS